MMDAVCDPSVRSVVVMSSAQVGKTEFENNVIGYHVDVDPSPIMLVLPTLELADAWSTDRLAPMLRDTPCLAGKVKDVRTRDSGNTKRHKSFPGGHVTISGANSPSSLASRPIRVLLFDEVDRFPVSAGGVDGEGDPVTIAERRTTTFWNKRVVMVSTPTNAGTSRIAKAFEESDRRFFMVPCPHCGDEQRMTWSHVVWDKELDDDGDVTAHKPETAAYACEHCGSLWSDVERWRAVRGGRWVATAPFNGSAGFHLSELYSPWVSLGDMARRFLEAKGDPQRLRVFVNTSLGEPWEEAVADAADGETLMARRESYPAELPDGVGLLTASVDVQDNRLEACVVGWGLDEEAWLIEHRIFPGDPSLPDVWATLDEFLLKRWKDADGREFGIQSAAVDTGGHHTQDAYAFCKARVGRRVWAIKGKSGDVGLRDKVWPKKPSMKNASGVPLYIVDTNSAKDVVGRRLMLKEAGPGFVHFPLDCDAEYFDQLLSEKAVLKEKGGRRWRVWEKFKKRNEAWDLLVYAYAALCGWVAMGGRLNQVVQRARSSSIEPSAAPISQPEATPTPSPVVSRPTAPRTSSWVGGGRMTGGRKGWL